MEKAEVQMTDAPTPSTTKFVTKRDGTKQPLEADKIKKRIESLADGLNSQFINFDVIVGKVIDGAYDSKFL